MRRWDTASEKGWGYGSYVASYKAQAGKTEPAALLSQTHPVPTTHVTGGLTPLTAVTAVMHSDVAVHVVQAGKAPN